MGSAHSSFVVLVEDFGRIFSNQSTLSTIFVKISSKLTQISPNFPEKITKKT